MSQQIKAVKASSIEEFVTEVNFLLTQGWEFHGEVKKIGIVGKELLVQFFVKEVDLYFENDELGVSYHHDTIESDGEYPG